MIIIANLNKNYSFLPIYFASNKMNMQSALKSMSILFHLFLFVALLFLLSQEKDIVQEKLYVSLLIFIALNLTRLFQKDNKTNSNDQL